MKFPFFLSALVTLAGLGLPLQAQTVDDLVVTTAISTTGTDGQPWVYVVWDSATGAPLVGRTFSVNLKSGAPDSAGSFTRQAVVASNVTGTAQPAPQAPGPVLSASILGRAACLGEDMVRLDNLLVDALRGLQSPAPAIPEGRAERLSALLARGESGVQASTLPILRRLSPAVAMALGQAWAGPLPDAGSLATIEVRDFDPISRSDRGVVGRVTLTAGSYVPLPAPGAPVQVPDTAATGDLNIRIRWAMTPELSRRQAQLQGFHVWRVEKAFALARNWQTAAPSVAQLTAAAATAPASVKLRTSVPQRESKEFTAATVANFSAAPAGDPDTYFYGDDNDRYRPGGVPFADGAEFFNFAVPHDLLGRPGMVSPGGATLACRCLPPPTPRDLRVAERTNNQTSGPQEGQSELHLTWLPNVNTALDTTEQYQIFVSDNASSFAPNPLPATPAPVLLATLPAATATPGEYSKAPSAADPLPGTTRWYSVRAVHLGPRGPLYSAYAPPAPGVVRRLAPATAPSAANTFSHAFCARTAILKTSVSNVSQGGSVAQGTVRLNVTNESADLAWLEVVQPGTNRPAARVFFEPGEPLLYDFLSPGAGLPVTPAYHVEITAVSKGGVRSRTLTLDTESGSNGDQLVVINLRASVLAAGQITTAEPLAATLLGTGGALETTSVSTIPDSPGMGVANVPASLPQSGDYLIEVQTGEFQFSRHAVTAGWLGKVVFPLFTLPSLLNYRIYPIDGDAAACQQNFHHIRQPGWTQVQPVVVGFAAPSGMAEYRLYRQVDTGDLSLIKHGELTVPPGTPLTYSDFGLPPVSACLNYFVQTFDRDGNSSPMQRLGSCVQAVAPLEIPLMGQPEFTGTAANAKVRLRWTSAIEGVERFEIVADPDDGGEVASPGFTPLAPRSTLPKVSATASIAGLPVFNTGKRSFKDRASGAVTKGSFAHSSAFLTALIGSGVASMGRGPVFTLEFEITPGVEYHFSVAALGASTGRHQARSDYSPAVSFRWTPPPPPPSADCVLPWPARDLPPVTRFHPDIVARRFVPGVGDTATVIQGEVPLWPRDHDASPVGVRLGRLKGYSIATLAGYATPDPLDDFLDFTTAGFVDSTHAFLPNALFRGQTGAASLGQISLPVVMYRRQMANPAFPVTPDTVVQCSPLITTLSYETKAASLRLRDPYIGLSAAAGFSLANLPAIRSGAPTEEFPAPMDFSLYLLDTKPVLNGALYHYYLMRFDASGEPSEIIDAGEVEIPAA